MQYPQLRRDKNVSRRLEDGFNMHDENFEPPKPTDMQLHSTIEGRFEIVVIDDEIAELLGIEAFDDEIA